MYNKIWLSSPHMCGEEEKLVKGVFDSNWIAPLGPEVNAFEHRLEEYCGIKHAAALSSGTAAIHLALILSGVGVGDTVLVSSFTFSATVNPVVYQGATPVLIDSEPDTWNMDPVLLESAINELGQKGSLPKAIILVHLYGMPSKISEIVEIANRYDIPLIEDAAEALGSKYAGRNLGQFGSMAVLSFNGNKIITTSGGGALLSNNEELISKARFLSTQARDIAPHYQHSQIGYNYRLSNVLAAIGRGQMEVIDQRVEKRRSHFEFYKEQLSTYEGIAFQEEPDSFFFSNRWLSCILINPSETGFSNEDLRLALEEENIESRPLWKPMHLQPVFSNCPVFSSGCSDRLFDMGLCLPSGSNMTDDDKVRIMEVIKRQFEMAVPSSKNKVYIQSQKHR